MAYFDGDNFGATYTGVTREKVTILFYIQAGSYGSGRRTEVEVVPRETYWDLFEPPEPDEPSMVRAIRAYQTYFNERYQLYGRVAHFFVYSNHDGLDAGSQSEAVGGENPAYSPEKRRAHARENFEKIKPFAVISTSSSGNEEVYLEEMAKFGVLNFGAFASREAAFFQRYPGLIWGFEPSLELRTRMWTSWVCSKIAEHPVSFSGNGDHGSERVYGLLRPTVDSRSGPPKVADMAKEQLARCGIEFAAEQSYDEAGRHLSRNPEATENMAVFLSAGVTTIIWPVGYEIDHSHAGDRLGYYPEWVINGDYVQEGYNAGQYQNQRAFHERAFVVTPVTFQPALKDRPCYQAWKEADPHGLDAEISAFGCAQFYNPTRQLFTGIQVAGPRLTPESLDQGMHAIPAVASDDPQVPACFYEINDYTCVKDAAVGWYDARGQSPASRQPGCWRMLEAGKRYLGGQWPPGDPVEQKTPDDPCNSHLAFI